MIFNSKKKAIEGKDVVQLGVPADRFAIPLIALFDTDKSVEARLTEDGFSVEVATLGSYIRLPDESKRQNHYLTLNQYWPSNLHEFDICVLDLTKDREGEYAKNLFRFENNSASTAHAFMCAYPQKVFDGTPLAAKMLSEEINVLLEKQSLVIVFCGNERSAHYKFAKFDSYDVTISNEWDASIFELYREFPAHRNKSGKKISLAKNKTVILPILADYLDKASYQNIFTHPVIWNKENQKNEKSLKFFPILVNAADEIVGFLQIVNKGIVVVLPDIEQKASLISDLFNNSLPEIIPAIFPSHGKFTWLSGEDYVLPGEASLNFQREAEENRHEKEIATIEELVAINREKHKFLHELIYQTGDELVKAVEIFLKWLGFASVVNMDETNPTVREEDIQVETEKGLLVVEVKGIGGTSTDKDCSQISKIKSRRWKERGRFDVFGLYIVNHQRYLPPRSRTNPPFTDHQLQDALHDERGLITTYMLFKAYFMIEEGFLAKDWVRDKLFEFGLIDLQPADMRCIGVAKEIFKDGTVVILNLTGEVILKTGSDIFVKKSDQMRKLTLVSIQVNNVAIDECSSGEVGLLLSAPVKKGAELYIREK